MRQRTRGGAILAAAAVGLVLAAGSGHAAGAAPRTFRAGVRYDLLSRTVVWEGDTEASRFAAHMISAVAETRWGDAVTFSLAAGLSLSDFRGLVFDSLPISLELDPATLKGIVLGADVSAVLADLGRLEIGAAGRFVYSFGLARTWPLEDFAVVGDAVGRTNWMEVSAGPRVAYRSFGMFVPYVEVAARWLVADVTMAETLGDLQGNEKKRVKGDLGFSASLGGDIEVSDRLTVRFKAGALPRAGGVDAVASVGILAAF